VSAPPAFAIVREDGRELLLAPAESGLSGRPTAEGTLCELTPEHASRVRELEPRLAPRPLGLAASFGFGDRIGLATPGHVRALRRTGTTVAPILAQQSVRELARTGRTFGEVLDAATWGALAEGWLEGYGADADHLKQPGDVRAAAAAGFTTFTLDPGDHVDEEGATLGVPELERRFAALPWDELEDAPDELLRRQRAPVELPRGRLAGEDEQIVRAAVTYGRAIAQVAALAAFVPRDGEIEVSVDEIAHATTPFEHAFVVRELQRLGVDAVGIAPRFPGALEKGIEFRGSFPEFRAALHAHGQIAEALGPYKLSLHSGSDKLSLYAALARETGGRFHIKTAGTSYLEALRVAAPTRPALVREIWLLARERFAVDRASYALTASVDEAPGADIPDERLSALLDDDTARRILHVTFGSVLGDARLKAALCEALAGDAGDGYAAALERHFAAHLEAIADVPLGTGTEA
jgi:hypothetical protein